jgi:hypothetical protein
MAKPKPKRSKPQKSAEPTVAQQRQAYYEARARRESLEELGVAEAEPVKPAPDTKAALEALDSFDRLMVLYGICRWTAVAGQPPEPEDWESDKDWPQPDAVESLFGSWDAALSESGVLDLAVPGMLERVAKAHQDLAKRAEELERGQRRLEEEGQRVPELERQMERHKTRRDEADLRAREVEGERERLVAERDEARARAAELQARIAGLEAQLADAAQQPAAPPDDAWVHELEGALSAHARSEAERNDLHDRMEQLRAERERDRRTIAELSAMLARKEDGEAPDTETEEDAPVTVLEAVERAAKTASHVRFAPRAFETASDSPFRRPGLVLDTLRRIDRLAERYEAGDMGMSLSQAAQDEGITQWKAGVSELARTRWRDEYLVTVEGHEVELGPHVGLGSGSGAGFVARIYMHVSDGTDGLPRGITVGVVGRHLPDTTT